MKYLHPLRAMVSALCLLSLLIPMDAFSEESADAKVALIKEVSGRIKSVDTAELKRMIDNNEKFVLMDVRPPQDIERSGKIHAANQTEIPSSLFSMIKAWSIANDPTTPIITYCNDGVRSAFAVETLQQMGFTEVYSYRDGLKSWKEQGLPVEN